MRAYTLRLDIPHLKLVHFGTGKLWKCQCSFGPYAGYAYGVTPKLAYENWHVLCAMKDEAARRGN